MKFEKLLVLVDDHRSKAGGKCSLCIQKEVENRENNFRQNFGKLQIYCCEQMQSRAEIPFNTVGLMTYLQFSFRFGSESGS